MSEMYDIAVIGGGINGCGIARDAAGRGMSVALCEQGDLGGATSSASTKLIHGGLRYLEHYEFRLVHHALAERERLWGIAPHIIWPLRFVLPHRRGLRPPWMLRLGLFLYDHLGARKVLPGTRTIHLSKDLLGAPLRDVSSIGFEYSDCWVQDNRLVVLNAMDAAKRGATILARTRCVRAVRSGSEWQLTLRRKDCMGTKMISARSLVNAAGPWVGDVGTHVLGESAGGSVRLVQGSHIVVPKLYEHDRCYIFQNADGRIFFAIPYENDFTLIGTTDRDYQGDPAEVAAGSEEIEYLCKAASSYFCRSIRTEDVVWTYSGVRPLYNDGATAAQETTRDYVLKLDSGPDGRAPLLSVFGGKITTYRCLAEDAMRELSVVDPRYRRNEGWTAMAPLPGGDFPRDGAAALAEDLVRRYPFLSSARGTRFIRHYGTRSLDILGDARTSADLGRDFGGGLTEREVAYLRAHEYAETVDDIVWRRTKAGLHMTSADIGGLADLLGLHYREHPHTDHKLLI